MSLFSSTELNAFDSFLADLVATDHSVLHPFASLTGTTPCSSNTNADPTVNDGYMDTPSDLVVSSSPNTSLWTDRQYPWTYRTKLDLMDRPGMIEKAKTSIPYETFRSYAPSDFDCTPHLPEYPQISDVTRWKINAGIDQLSAISGIKAPGELEANLINLPTHETYLVSLPLPVPHPPLVKPYVDSDVSSSDQPTNEHILAHASSLDGRPAFSPPGPTCRQQVLRIPAEHPDDTGSLESKSNETKLGVSHVSSCSCSSSSSSSSTSSSALSSNRQTPCLGATDKREDKASRQQSSTSPGFLTATQKRANHIYSEKKRRETIKKRTEALCGIVPSLRELCFIKEEQEEEAAGAAAAMAKEGSRNGDDEMMGKKRKKDQKTAGRRGRRSGEDRERLSFKIGGPKSEKIILIKTIEHLRTLQIDRHRLLTRLNDLRQQGLSRGIPIDATGMDGSFEWEYPWEMAEREDGEDGLEEAG